MLLFKLVIFAFKSAVTPSCCACIVLKVFSSVFACFISVDKFAELAEHFFKLALVLFADFNCCFALLSSVVSSLISAILFIIDFDNPLFQL